MLYKEKKKKAVLISTYSEEHLLQSFTLLKGSIIEKSTKRFISFLSLTLYIYITRLSIKCM